MKIDCDKITKIMNGKWCGLMPSRSFRNDNPGNLRHHGAVGVFPIVERHYRKDDGHNYAPLPTVADGCAALAATAYKNSTVAEMIAKYAPSRDRNDPGWFVGGQVLIAPISFTI
jgi:hypothetical protein